MSDRQLLGIEGRITARGLIEVVYQVWVGLGRAATGDTGRVAGTYEKSILGQPSITDYALAIRIKS